MFKCQLMLKPKFCSRTARPCCSWEDPAKPFQLMAHNINQYLCQYRKWTTTTTNPIIQAADTQFLGVSQWPTSPHWHTKWPDGRLTHQPSLPQSQHGGQHPTTQAHTWTQAHLQWSWPAPLAWVLCNKDELTTQLSTVWYLTLTSGSGCWWINDWCVTVSYLLWELLISVLTGVCVWERGGGGGGGGGRESKDTLLRLCVRKCTFQVMDHTHTQWVTHLHHDALPTNNP